MRTTSLCGARFCLVAAMWLSLAVASSSHAAKPGGGGGSPPPTPGFRYTIKTLGTLGSNWSTATAMNDAGDVVGYSATSTNRQHPFLWIAATEQMVDLQTRIPAGTGWELYSAAAVNNAGQVLVSARIPTVANSGSLLRLDPNDETGLYDIKVLPNNQAGGYAMNQNGDCLGTEVVADPDSSRYHSILWIDGEERIDLGHLQGINTFPCDLTDRDATGRITITGTADNGDQFAWRTTYDLGNDAAAPLQALGAPYNDREAGAQAKANGLNNLGDIVGWTFFSRTETLAFRYRNGSWTNLGRLNPSSKTWIYSTAVDINDAGYVIGGSTVGSQSSVPNTQPFLYHDSFKMVNLDDLTDGLPVALKGQFGPLKINAARMICGNIGGGVNVPYRLVPYTTP